MRVLSSMNILFVVMRFLNDWYFVIGPRLRLRLCDLSKLDDYDLFIFINNVL